MLADRSNLRASSNRSDVADLDWPVTHVWEVSGKIALLFAESGRRDVDFIVTFIDGVPAPPPRPPLHLTAVLWRPLGMVNSQKAALLFSLFTEALPRCSGRDFLESSQSFRFTGLND